MGDKLLFGLIGFLLAYIWFSYKETSSDSSFPDRLAASVSGAKDEIVSDIKDAISKGAELGEAVEKSIDKTIGNSDNYCGYCGQYSNCNGCPNCG